MENVVITGANSFLGIHLIEALSINNYNIFAVIRRNAKREEILQEFKNVKVIEADMNKYKELDKLINASCDYFFSFAWNGTRGAKRNNKKVQESNYKYSVEAIKSMIGIGCKTIVLAGSQAEYGVASFDVTEETICNPVTGYGKMKLKLYKDMKEFCKTKDVRIIEPRFFSLYGPLDYEKTLIMEVTRKMLHNIDCELTEGTQLWDYLHVKDAADALVKLIESNCSSGIYNFGSGDSRTIKEYIGEIKEIINSRSRLLFGKLNQHSSVAVDIKPDISKLKKTIDWYPDTSFRRGIMDLIVDLNNDSIK